MTVFNTRITQHLAFSYKDYLNLMLNKSASFITKRRRTGLPASWFTSSPFSHATTLSAEVQFGGNSLVPAFEESAAVPGINPGETATITFSQLIVLFFTLDLIVLIAFIVVKVK